MIIVYYGIFGKPYLFQWLERDHVTPRNLSATIVNWIFKSQSNPSIVLTLSTTITDPVNGLFYATMTTAISEYAVDDYDTQFEQIDNMSNTLIDLSEKVTVSVIKSGLGPT